MSFYSKHFFALTACAAICMAPFLAQPVLAQSYTLTDLGTLGGPFSNGSAVNNQGQVTGDLYVNGLNAYHAFLSGANGGSPRDLGTLGGANSFGNALNDQGQVTGSAYPGYNGSHAFLSGVNGGPLQDLGTLGGNYSTGFGVTATGQVGGYSTIANGDYHAFISGVNGSALQDLGTLGGNNSYGLGINATGQVTGESLTANGDTHAFLSGAGGGPLRDLGTLGALEGQGPADSRGIGVNSAGQVTGYAATADGHLHAFLSGNNGGALQDLGTLGGGYSSGNSVNDQGQVVGFSYLEAGNTTAAFLYSSGKMINLNTLLSPSFGFILTSASGISDTGFITGTGINVEGRQDAFLLTPIAAAVPEASTTVSFSLLLVLGLGGLVIAKKKVRA